MHAPALPSRRSAAFLAAFAVANIGGVLAYLPLLTLLLPIKVEAMDGAARIGLFTATVVAGAIAASLANIAFGWLSDRSVRRGGGRRAWMAGGVAVTAVSYAGVASATTPVALIAAIVAFQIAVNMLLAPMMAIMAEEVPDAQKGIAGGLIALGSPLASAFSAVLVGPGIAAEAGRLAILAATVAACTLPLLFIRARILPVAPVPVDVPPRRDLIVAGVSRLVVQIAGVVTQVYLLYYFESIVPAADRAGLPMRIGHLLTLAFIVPLPAALLLGRLSDLMRRRKPILLVAAMTAAAGLVVMAAAGDWRTGAIGFGIYAAGSSVFVSLHAALAMQLLPSAEHRGRDLGLLNLANTLPSLLGPPIAWMFATPQDFAPPMVALAVLTACGGLGMLGVRSWR